MCYYLKVRVQKQFNKMIKKQSNDSYTFNFSKIEDETDILKAEQEELDNQPSIFKQNYGLMSLGFALIVLAIVLLVLTIKSQDSLIAMIIFTVLSFMGGFILLIIPFLTSKYRLCSIPLIELAGNDIFDDFHFLTTDNTFDKALQTSFGSVFYDKLTEKKELEVLKGKYKGYSFTTYDFKASNQSISSIQSRMEGTLIRIRFNTGVLKPSYAATNNLSDFFLPLEKLSIGGDGMTYFGDSKDDLNNHIDIKKIKDLDQLTILSIDQNGISVLLFGKTMDIRRIKKDEVSQESYENLCLNFNPLLTVLNSIH